MSSPAIKPQHHTAYSESEPELTDRDFSRVAARVFKMSGIVLLEHKRQMVFSRLQRRLRALNLPTFASYLDKLDQEVDRKELQEFTNSLTTNLTAFFRESHHFTHLEENVLAQIMKSNERRLRIWSAGCSTGEEPYSLALTILGQFDPVPSDFKILATDLDTNVLNHGKAATYKDARGEAIPQRFHKYLEPKNASGEIKVGAAARSLIAFRQLNMFQSWPVQGPFDAIMCRNVLIYFNADMKAQLVTRFAELLAPGAFLYLGHSESLREEHPLLDNLGNTIYRRKT